MYRLPVHRDEPVIRIPPYWFWFTLAWGGLCLTPCLDDPNFCDTFRFGGMILACAYIYPQHPPMLAGVLGIHTVVATILAVVAAVFQRSREARKGRGDSTVCAGYGIGTLLLATTVLAGIFGLLLSLGAPAVVYGCVLVATAGYFVTSAWPARGHRKTKGVSDGGQH